jgi:solute carrier family 45 protein 1/2/4
MAGGGFFVAGAGGDEEHDYAHGGHAVQWVGAAAVKGPKWGKLPLLTIGMLGIQCVWSIEMGYGAYIQRTFIPSVLDDEKRH